MARCVPRRAVPSPKRTSYRSGCAATLPKTVCRGKTWNGSIRMLGFSTALSGPAAYKHDFAGIAMEQCRYLTPRHFQTLLGQLPLIVDTGSVSIHFGQSRQQGIEYLLRDWCGGVVVEVIMLHLQTPVYQVCRI